MKRPLILAIVFLLGKTLFAQCGIVKTEAYRQVHMPGMEMVDEQGRPVKRGPDTTFTIFVEAKSQQLGWGWAWQGRRRFKVTVPIEVLNDWIIGKSKESGEYVYVKPATGNSSIVLELQHAAYKKAARPVKPGCILLQVKCAKKMRYVTVPVVLDLYTPPSQ